jgi:CheY-like chemotaxis protein
VSDAPQDVVLVVEDDRDTRDALVELLRLLGYGVIEAQNGRQALELLRSGQEKPCMILLDLMMPVMNGWQFLEEQRGDPSLSSIPVVVLTADASAPRRAAELSVAELLKKPVLAETLSDAIARLC